MSLVRMMAEGAGWGPLDDRWYGPIGGSSTISGVSVSPQNALSSSPLWAGVNIKSGVLASLPLVIFRRRLDGGKDRAPYHSVYPLLHDAPQGPTGPQTAFEFKKMMEVWRILWGHAEAEIRLRPDGFVDSLWPIHPDCIRQERIPGGDVRYLVRQEDGRERPYNRESIFHLSGLSLDGAKGLSLIEYARESIALNISARNYSASFMRQGGRPSGVLTHPGKLTKDGRQNMREEWEAIHGGAQNAHKIAILQEGVSWQATGMTAEDAQLIGLLEWSVEDIARFLNIPLHMLQETSKVTSWGSGIEEITNGYVTFSLMPDLILWQQTVTKDLPVAQGGFFAEFVVDALLRGKTLERYQAYQIATGGAAWMAPNEARTRENFNPLPGADAIQAPPAPRPPAAPPSNQPAPPSGLAEVFVRDTAERIVRRETAALERAQRQGRGDWLDPAAHASFVAEALHIEEATAVAYVDDLVDGEAMDDPGTRVANLIGLAMEASS